MLVNQKENKEIQQLLLATRKRRKKTTQWRSSSKFCSNKIASQKSRCEEQQRLQVLKVLIRSWPTSLKWCWRETLCVYLRNSKSMMSLI